LAFTVSSQLYRLPQTAAYYATQYASPELYNDATGAAQSDYSLANYDKVLVLFSALNRFPGSQWQDIDGLCQIGTSNVWVNGEFDFGVVAHELGHTFGLYHANFWQTKNTSGNPVSDDGSSVEYIDPFDTM